MLGIQPSGRASVLAAGSNVIESCPDPLGATLPAWPQTTRGGLAALWDDWAARHSATHVRVGDMARLHAPSAPQAQRRRTW